MKVVFATGIYPPDIGGPATSVSMLAGTWSAQGHSVTVVTYSDASRADTDPSAYKVIRIPRAQPIWKRYAAFLHAVWRAADEPGPIFAQDGIASGLPALLVAWTRRRRLIVRIAGDYAWEQAQVKHGYTETLEAFQHDHRIPFVLKLLRALQQFVFRHADDVITPSAYLGGILRGWGVSGSRIRLVYNGVHLPPLPAERGTFPHRIVAAGRLVPWKNFDVLIKALPRVLDRFPDAELFLAGDGPELPRLQALASAPMLAPRVTFAGRMGRDQLWKEIGRGGVFALVSSYEGFSHQLVEASACAVPIIASRAGGNPELVEDGKNGLLVDVGDVQGLADAIIRFFEDPALARSASEAALQASKTFTIEQQIAQTTDVVLGKPGARIVLVSRDGSAADPSSRTAARMRLYGERVEHLRVVCLSKEEAASVALSPRVHVDVLDVRKDVRPWRLIRRVREAIASAQATLVVAQDPFEAGLVASAAARRERVPLVIEEHGGVFLSDHWRQESLKNRLLFPLGLRILKRAQGLRAVSAKIERDLQARFPSTRIIRIPVLTEARSCRSSAQPEIFGFVGRFVSQKNPYGLLEAFALVAKTLPSAKLLMIGAGPLENGLKARAFALGLQGRVEWITHTERIDEVYAQIGTLVLFSWYEGWARVVPEAMACGVPVIMTDVGCAGELMRNGIEGYVVPVGNEEILARAMVESVRSGKHDWMKAAASARAQTLPTPEALADRLTDFWKSFGNA